MKTLLIFILALLMGCSVKQPVPEVSMQASVVAVESHQQPHDWVIPWNKSRLSRNRGSAVVVPNQLLLTSSNLVSHANLIEVRSADSDMRYEAFVVRIDPLLNLALLKVEDPTFWKGLKPVALKAPERGSVSLQAGMSSKPVTGRATQMTLISNRISQTKVPIVKVQSGLKKNIQGLSVFQNQRLVGIGVKLVGEEVYAVPAQLMIPFVASYEKEKANGLVQSGFEWKTVSHASIKSYLGVSENQPGVLITRIRHHGTGSDDLQTNDFLTAIDGKALSNKGHLEDSVWGPLPLDYWISQKGIGEQVELSIIRGGKQHTLITTTSSLPYQKQVVPFMNSTEAPRYIIRGGLVFQELTQNYIDAWESQMQHSLPLRLKIFQGLEAHLPQNKNRRVVLLSFVLADAINIGYQDLGPEQIVAINGKPIQRLEDVIAAFDSHEGDFHKIHFLPSAERLFMILPAAELPEASQRILSNFDIPQSENL